MDGKYHHDYWTQPNGKDCVKEEPLTKRLRQDDDIGANGGLHAHIGARASQSEPDYLTPSTSDMNSASSSNSVEDNDCDVLDIHGLNVTAQPASGRPNWRTMLAKVDVPAPVEQKTKKSKPNEVQLKHFASIQPNMSSLSEKDIREILDANGIKADEERTKAMDQLIDIAVFGTPFPCVECPDGAFVFCPLRQMYVCQGYQSEYTRCFVETKKPQRSDFVLPKFYNKPKYAWLRDCRHPDLKDRVLSKAVGFKSQNVGACSEVKAQIIKNNTIVEAGFEHAADSHVMTTQEGDYFTAMLNKVDVSSNVNAYCKMQLLKLDTKDVYYVYSCTGTIGKGDEKKGTREFGPNYYAAQMYFEELFKQQTGNYWGNRKYFNKRPGMFSLADVNLDYSEVKDAKVIKPGSQTKLHRAVKEVIMLISDKKAMQEVMTALKIDVEKMPLGKLSEKTISSAFQLLSDLEKLIQSKQNDKLKFADASNHFYTLIPHSFDEKQCLPRLTKLSQIKEKCRLLEVLRDFQAAVGVFSGGSFINGHVADPVDVHYLNLKCELKYMEPSDPEFSTISKYLSSTHGETHEFSVDLIDVLYVQRAMEDSKYKGSLGNRKLLWHGSGITNFTGILSQGLRIAPPEAPATGYMFGKGIYFADMVSKSARYCRAGDRGTCFLLLCEVALGIEQPEYHATNNRVRGTHSVKGIGMTQPCSGNTVAHADGYEVPMGPPIKALPTPNGQTLLYNEYIVYDVDQVKLKYLLKCRINVGRRK